MTKPIIGITIGDLNGIGLEVILKTFQNEQLLNNCTPVIYGSSKVVSYHKNIVGIEFAFNAIRSVDQATDDRVNVVNCWQDNVNISLGKATEHGGKYAYQSLEWAVKDLQAGLIDALVTAPINKEAMQMANFPFPGHTEYLTQALGARESVMMLVHDELRVALATNHLPLRAVPAKITKELLLQKINLLHESLCMDFGIDRPTIAVLGLNPHAGDGGLLGMEEEQQIRPAVIEAKKGGKLVMGPFPADGFFGSGQYRKYDAILAMYHDQGLAPFKALSFGNGVNYTAGLSAVRTSPDHGTAYDLAGKNGADPTSFRNALFMAIDITRQRRDYKDMRANPLRIREKPIDSDDGNDIIEE
jgi:4-hydroxythreonine-4-phosphate dehydrogenase